MRSGPSTGLRTDGTAGAGACPSSGDASRGAWFSVADDCMRGNGLVEGILCGDDNVLLQLPGFGGLSVRATYAETGEPLEEFYLWVRKEGHEDFEQAIREAIGIIFKRSQEKVPDFAGDEQVEEIIALARDRLANLSDRA